MPIPPPTEALAIKDIIGPVASSFTTLIAAFVAYHFAKRQLQKKAQLDVKEDLRKRQADALQTAWGLLQSLSLTENGRNFLHYQQAKKYPQQPGQKPARQYFMHVPNAQAFVFEHLPTAFYASGAGLHWHTDLKDKFFECRSLLYAYLLAEQQAQPTGPTTPGESQVEPLRPVNKPQLAERIEALYQEINELLKKEMQNNYAQQP